MSASRHESLCVPTAHSPELLLRILRTYPTLESLVSVSHRSSITNLANTCKTLRYVLTYEMAPIGKLFRSCTYDQKRCNQCNTGLCKECVIETREVAPPGDFWAESGFQYVLVGGRTAESRRDIVMMLREVLPGISSRSIGIIQQIYCHYWCGTCILQRRAWGKSLLDDRRNEWLTFNMYMRERWWGLPGHTPRERRIVCPTLKFRDIPNIANTCTCAGFADGCQISPHLVEVSKIPRACELAGKAFSQGNLPAQLRFMLLASSPHRVGEGNVQIPFYILD